MPDKFKHKNGATIAGHADKWSDENRSSTSHDAGQGSKGSRNQGTGIKGKQNAMPSQGIDTSKMDKSEKLKYFNSLGLLQPKQELSIKTWPETLRKVFKDEPVYIKDITTAIKSIEPARYQQAIQSAFNAYNEITKQSDDVYDIYAAIMQALQG
ncbi:hypothetical protein [Yersinia phage fHe-Yen9-04]|uniref:Uncharacterized protein n=1 Tax=Yersinia phage fHe-Yen9-04 TaxID=2052742 RepID=A0A2C9CZ51_9CAUD|nr:virion structural protein [Yersinia phage fHe-Yen9-04]SOK58292.1 hypothetical protein [Yersinia phage fHe-Yen9-04]VUE36061.1 hypothetical protein [Yersinia phage fHe-Yen9-04]